MIKTSIVCTGSLLVLLSLPSLAQQTTSPDEDKARTSQSQESVTTERTHTDSNSMRSGKFMDYSFMDLDQDGRISKTEFEQAFAKLDTNSDGYLSSDEIRQGAGSYRSGKTSHHRSETTESNTERNTTQP